MARNLDKTLEDFDKHYWVTSEHDSMLVKTCTLLRKKKLKDFTIEDLRILIGQNFSLDILIPIAIVKLSENILAEGDSYEGNLLVSVLRVKKLFA